MYDLLKDDLDFRAIAIDLPGHGTSSTKHYPTAGVGSFARAVLDLIDELSLPNVVLLGHSMGVRVIVETWRQAISAGKPKLRGLCFLDGSHYKFRKSLFAFDSADARSASLSDEQKHEKMAEAFDRMLSPGTPSEFRQSALEHVKSIDLQYSEAMRSSFIQYDYDTMDDVLEKVGNTGVPVLSLQATGVDAQNQRAMLKEGQDSRWMQHVRKLVPEARTMIVKESGHFPHVDQPGVVANKLREFVQTL
ncbi:hypothetical protein LTR09_001097 [Extremus antarcticus]|uniref:AB hydrolase-1 domain-containing protein n=1 Tax=Extremus antarcticus TaxID=702011 RepID=A0AAJ0GI92_9PEZI|nr:hypothetical protein LTR09_001097 [Extremus antarcticus]